MDSLTNFCFCSITPLFLTFLCLDSRLESLRPFFLSSVRRCTTLFSCSYLRRMLLTNKAFVGFRARSSEKRNRRSSTEPF